MSYIENTVREHTAELIADALEHSNDPIELAADILDQITAGWIAAMDENEHLDLAVDMVNQQEVST